MQYYLSLALQVLLLLCLLVLIQLVGRLVETGHDIKTAIYGWEEVYDVTE